MFAQINEGIASFDRSLANFFHSEVAAPLFIWEEISLFLYSMLIVVMLFTGIKLQTFLSMDKSLPTSAIQALGKVISMFSLVIPASISVIVFNLKLSSVAPDGYDPTMYWNFIIGTLPTIKSGLLTGLPFGCIAFYLLGKYGEPFIAERLNLITRTTYHSEGDSNLYKKLSRVRKFDPAKYQSSREGLLLLGLDLEKKPIWISRETWQSSHMQIAGATGSGKGVLSQTLLSQAARKDCVIVFDPKDDPIAPRVLANECETARNAFSLIKIGDGNIGIDVFESATENERYELLSSCFGLGEKGTDADYYRHFDRQAARIAAKYSVENNTTFVETGHALESLLSDDLYNEATGFIAQYKEVVAIAHHNETIDLAKVINNPGALYIVGTLRNPAVQKLQKAVLLRIMQQIESRDFRSNRTHVTIFLDEVKHLLSQPVVTMISTIRSGGCNLVLAHQSNEDFTEVSGDLNPQAVSGVIKENTTIKWFFQSNHPATCKYIENLSGTKKAYRKVSAIERNFQLANIENSNCTYHEYDSPVFNAALIQSLPKNTGVLKVCSDAAKIAVTSPLLWDGIRQGIVLSTRHKAQRKRLLIDRNKEIESLLETKSSNRQTKLKPQLESNRDHSDLEVETLLKQKYRLDSISVGIDQKSTNALELNPQLESDRYPVGHDAESLLGLKRRLEMDRVGSDQKTETMLGLVRRIESISVGSEQKSTKALALNPQLETDRVDSDQEKEEQLEQSIQSKFGLGY